MATFADSRSINLHSVLLSGFHGLVLDGNDASSLASLVALNHKVVRQFFEQVKDILGVDLLGTLSSTGVK